MAADGAHEEPEVVGVGVAVLVLAVRRRPARHGTEAAAHRQQNAPVKRRDRVDQGVVGTPVVGGRIGLVEARPRLVLGARRDLAPVEDDADRVHAERLQLRQRGLLRGAGNAEQVARRLEEDRFAVRGERRRSRDRAEPEQRGGGQNGCELCWS